MLIYFSEVLPKKFINEVQHFKGIMVQLSPRGLLSDRTQDIVSARQRQGEEWQVENVKILESGFDDVIEQVYEKLFIDRIWGKNMYSQVKKEEFIECLGGRNLADMFGGMMKKNKNTIDDDDEE